MKIVPARIPDVLLIEPLVFADERGFFLESFNQKAFNQALGREVVFVQDCHSRSTKNVVRGLHCQISPMAQGKLVRVVQGKVFDVAVDLRKDSKTYGQWLGEILSADNKRQIWIPPGFAHGFLTLSDSADFVYKTTEYYSREHERCLRWDDPAIGITWPLQGDAVLSPKDSLAPLLASF